MADQERGTTGDEDGVEVEVTITMTGRVPAAVLRAISADVGDADLEDLANQLCNRIEVDGMIVPQVFRGEVCAEFDIYTTEDGTPRSD